MKVGEYVRTNLKNEIVICKVIDIIHSTSMNDNRMVFDKPTKFTYYVEDNKNYKSSPNIIDLLELGDLVRLFMEDDIDKEDTNIFELIAITNDKKEIGVFTKDFEIEFFPIENLRGIVTHEQFSQMEYRIGE